MISVVIVNWNSGAQLVECVASVHDIDLVKEVLVIDNASSDGSCAGLHAYSKVRVLPSGGNLGFAKANNLAMLWASGEFLMFLNPDATGNASAVEEVHRFMSSQAHSQVGVVGVQLRDGRGVISRSCARFPTTSSMVAQAIGIDRWISAAGFMMTDWDHAASREVDHVIGAFYVIRRQLFDALGGFDERFFLYLEDLDLSLRVRQAGWRTVYLANVAAFHAGGGTSQQVKARRLFYALRSRLVYAHKHFSGLGFSAVLLATLCLEPWTRMAWGMFQRSRSGVGETAAAFLQLVRWLPRWLLHGDTR